MATSTPRPPKAYLACYLVLIRKEKILLLRRFNTGFRDGEYSMIAGHLENKETVWEAMVREAKEEGGLNLNPEGLKVVHVMHRFTDREYIDLFVTSDTNEEPSNTEPQKSDDLGWFDLEELPKATVPYIRAAIERIRKGEIYSEYAE
ncbi:MAG: NUDIX domain-containing protein [Candidatus Micrarchaeota archaeon]|nr:NUDIX domain-containing protein [Candidatus Micrarchaeota archaeon]